jgi:hypothetical protein
MRRILVDGKLAVMAMCVVLAACSGSPSVSIAQSAYALGAALDTAEQAELVYLQSPAATKATSAEIKALDAAAYNALLPVLANGDNATADEIVAAEAAVSALTEYLVQHGVKS